MRSSLLVRNLLPALITLAAALPGSAGENRTQTLQHNGRSLEVSISQQFDHRTQQDIQAWIDFISHSLLQVYGHWPRQQWNISVAPASAAADDPIPWAQVHRGATDSVEFFVAPQATTDALTGAWTGYHELAHLLIPYRGWGDIWFSEGLASYYQNILQARSGILTEQQMWQNIHDAFQRSYNDKAFDGQTLPGVSETLRDHGGFMRVYWSGAWYFLAADVRLRRQSGNRISLDLALDKLNRCCAEQQLSAPEIADKLDQLNQVLLFRSLYDKLQASTSTPPVDQIFASLGISVHQGQVQLQQAGPGAVLRRQIAQPLAL